ncbi:MAG: hypothetical protein AAGG51_01535 [Cyanobacteria bacterium P01_G01_bin.54]
MPDLATVQVSVPIAWLSQLQQLAQQRDRATPDLLQEAIAQYLGVPLPQREERLHQLEAEMRQLKGQLAGLNRQLSQLQRPSPIMPDASVAIASGNGQGEIIAQPPEPENWIDDEPDEVLYDFLPLEER